jgi:hypothetical protein
MPVPYEWADPTALPDRNGLEFLWNAVIAANEKLAGIDTGLGLSINHRFKPPLSKAMFATAEFQGIGPASGTDQCVIFRMDDVDPGIFGNLEQVTWHAFPDDYEELSEQQRRLLAILGEISETDQLKDFYILHPSDDTKRSLQKCLEDVLKQESRDGRASVF